MANKKILVADDDPGIVDVMQIVLEDEGYDVITTMNGEQIIDLCEQNPDLIFIDIWMSGIDGNIICKKLKADERLKHIPVIIFSANKNTRSISMECGADGFLSKPFELQELLTLTDKLISA